MPDATAALYRAELRRLEAALVAYRHVEGGGRGGRTSNNNGVAARCELRAPDPRGRVGAQRGPDHLRPVRQRL